MSSFEDCLLIVKRDAQRRPGRHLAACSHLPVARQSLAAFFVPGPLQVLADCLQLPGPDDRVPGLLRLFIKFDQMQRPACLLPVTPLVLTGLLLVKPDIDRFLRFIRRQPVVAPRIRPSGSPAASGLRGDRGCRSGPGVHNA